MKKLALLSLLSSGFISLQSFAGMVDLASAERYTIAVGSTNAAFGTLGLGSAVDIWGNVAATNNLTIGAGSIIRGDACSKYVNADASVTITGDKNVIFNFLDNAGMANFIFGGAIINGTFLSNTRSFQLGDGATLNNTRFLTNASIQGNVQTVKFGGKTTTEVPEPSTLLLMLIVLSFLLFRTNRKHQ